MKITNTTNRQQTHTIRNTDAHKCARNVYSSMKRKKKTRKKTNTSDNVNNMTAIELISFHEILSEELDPETVGRIASHIVMVGTKSDFQ